MVFAILFKSVIADRKDDFMKKTKICTINGNDYFIQKIVDRYVLYQNDTSIAVIIIIEYDNWKGHQIKFRPYSAPAELDYLDADGLTALEDAIEYLNEFCGVWAPQNSFII